MYASWGNKKAIKQDFTGHGIGSGEPAVRIKESRPRRLISASVARVRGKVQQDRHSGTEVESHTRDAPDGDRWGVSTFK